jgi:hypothetical protein
MYARILADQNSNFCKNAVSGNFSAHEEAISKAKLTPDELFRKSILQGWETLKGVSTTSAQIIAEQYTFMQWFKGEISCEKFIVNDRANNVIMKMLNTKPTNEQAAKIVGCVRGISKKSAQELFAKIDLTYFLGEYEKVTYGEKNTSFTKKKFDDVIEYLNTKI